MGIKFKQIDNLQNTFDSVSGNLQEEISNNIDSLNQIASGGYSFYGHKYFDSNVDFSGAQGILVNSDSIYTPNNVFANGVKIGYPLSSPRNSTLAPLGALQVSGGQIYLEDQLNIRNNSSIIIESGYIGVNIANPSCALDISGNITLQNNDRINWVDSSGSFANPTIFVNSFDELRLANNTNGDGGDIVFANKSGSQPSVRFKSDGQVGIGTNSPQGILDVSSTSSALIMPRLTDSEMNNISSPVNGMMIYNTTSGKFAGYASNAWVVLH